MNVMLFPGMLSAVLVLAGPARVTCNDDIDPLEPVVTQLSQTVSQLQAQLQSLQAAVTKSEPSVIFSVQHRDIRFNLTTGDTILFDNILANNGGGYSAVDGEFTTPVSGLYQVSYRGWSMPGHTGFLALKKNTDVISEVPVGDKNNEGASSQSLVLHLHAGDILVLAMNLITSGSYVQMMGNYRTTFMGYLLQED